MLSHDDAKSNFVGWSWDDFLATRRWMGDELLHLGKKQVQTQFDVED